MSTKQERQQNYGILLDRPQEKAEWQDRHKGRA